MTENKEYIKEPIKEYCESNRDEILAKRKAYYKAYYAAHRDEILAKQKAYKRAYREDHKAERKSYNKAYREAHRAEAKAYDKAYYAAHRDEILAQKKAYKRADTNSNGVTKNCIRERSRRYLFNVLKHTKMEGYEIHHCFGYDDYRNFIYIPKELHMQIHQYLRDNNIDADTDHYSKIAHLVVEWDGYVYIKA